MRQNAQVASKYLIKAAQDAETSIKCVEKPIYRNWHSSNSNNQLKWIEFHTLDMMDTIECVFSLFTGSCWQEERLCASYQSCWAQLTRSQRFQNNTFCTSLYCALTTSIIHLLFQITCFSHTVTFFFFNRSRNPCYSHWLRGSRDTHTPATTTLLPVLGSIA